MEILGLEPALFTFLITIIGLGVAILGVVITMYFHHRSDMNALLARMDAQRTELKTEMSTRFDAVDSRMDAQRTEFREGMNAQRTELKTEMSERFDAVDSRMDAQRTEFREGMNAQRTEIMSRFDSVDSRMDAMRSDFKSDMNAQRTELRAEMSEIGARLDVINTDMGDMKTEVALIRQKLEHVEWRLARLETQAGIPQNGADDDDAAARIAANGDLRREFEALKARMAALEAREGTA